MFDAAILDEMTSPRFNPPAFVEQMRMLPFAQLTDAVVTEIEAEFQRAKEALHEARAGLAVAVKDEEFKDDGEEFLAIIKSFEGYANEVGAKLYALEKQVKKAQRLDSSRSRDFDERLLKMAREDFEERIDTAVFWRALQARAWPTPVSKSFTSSSEVGNALRSAIG